MQGVSTTGAAPMPEALKRIPEKYWKDLTSDERIERLREQVKDRQFQIENLLERVYNLENKFFQHEHSPHDGRLVSPMDRYSTRGYVGLSSRISGKPSNPDEVYF